MAKKISADSKKLSGTQKQKDEQISTFFSGVTTCVILTAIFIFILSLAGSMDNVVEKWMGLVSSILVILILLVPNRTTISSKHITPLFYAFVAYVIWGGVSTFYAASGKFAIFEFSKLLVALFVYLFVLFFTNSNESGFRKISMILSSVGCFFGVISIDAASLGFLSSGFKSILGSFTEAYAANGAFEQGIRISSILGNPNTYSGFMAIAVLLSLYLTIHASSKKESRIASAMLAVNALAYLLAFSMGSLFMFLIACMIMLITSEKGTRIALFLLMSETAVTTFIFAFFSMLGLGKTGAYSMIPVLSIILNASSLIFADEQIRKKLSASLENNAKRSLYILCSIIVVFSCYLAAGFFITGNLTLDAGQTVMRAAYLPGGSYSLAVESSAPVSLIVESQNQYDLMRHTSTVIYSGPSNAPISFTVPEDSKIVKINFTATTEQLEISKAYYTGTAEGDIKLNHPLLPTIITNRFQDLFANENAVQRVIFFEDGIKLFSKSPIIGRGLGGFENGVYSVQDFYYETKYAHNHYIQVLSDLGVIGFGLFLSLLAFSARSIIKSRKKSRALYAIPVLSACTFQMFGQALTDAIWSTGIFLGFAAAMLALITVFCGEPFSPIDTIKANRLKVAEKVALTVFAAIFTLLLSGNLYAQAIAKSGVEEFEDIQRLVTIDRFEYNDYKLSYINLAPGSDDTEVLAQADIYANDLMKVESNSLTPYLMAYSFETYRDSDAFDIAKKGLENSKSNPALWRKMFDTFEEYIDPVGAHMNDAADRLQSSKYYVTSVLEIYDLLLERNKNSLDSVTLSPYNDAFIGKLLEIKATNLYSIDWTFTAIMTYAFDSECAVDTNQDGLPDNLTLQSGNIEKNEIGSLSVADNTIIDLDLYHKLGGKYKFNIKTSTPQGIKISFNGQDQDVQYTDKEAYFELDLSDNSEMALSKFTVTFPSAAEVDSISFITKLE